MEVNVHTGIFGTAAEKDSPSRSFFDTATRTTKAEVAAREGVKSFPRVIDQIRHTWACVFCSVHQKQAGISRAAWGLPGQQWGRDPAVGEWLASLR